MEATVIHKKSFFMYHWLVKKEPTQLAEFLNQYISSLFVTLESERLKKMEQNVDKMILPTTTSEQEQTITKSNIRDSISFTLLHLF